MYDRSSPFASPQPPGPTAKSAVALQVLRHAVLACEIAPGAAFSEVEVETRYSLGRAGVRAALQILVAEGLVAPLPRQGWQAKPITGAFIGDVITARRQAEKAIAYVGLAASERERVQTLVTLAAALAGRQDPQALVTARMTDRQILDLLAARTNWFQRKWLRELWDHSQRVVSFLESGEVQYRPLSREGLFEALAASDHAGATVEILRDVDHFETFASRALLRHPEAVLGQSHKRSARRSRVQKPTHSAGKGAQDEPRSTSKS
ncbi:GntR family transcriptional regulator [Microvirga lotononidis]|uniref:Transcriptional regulator n=1 Tax=Microvirga lotononidis TaxID=864069 RepID=I4YR37_9HYPH|nr:GntR family transcriptional regulator [Microvirga lotononidis]EIM26429.1 transcriptional regulator [Microvirga lotononidis]